MNDSPQPNADTLTEATSKPLELTSGVWIVLSLVALLGVSRLVRVDNNVRTLPPWGDDEPVIVSHVGQTHIFSFLGIKVLPTSWEYLSITDDALADRPTFVNRSTHSIIGLRLMQFKSWPPTDMEVTREEYGDVTIEWIEVDDRWWGRLTNRSPQAESHVTVIAITHLPRAELNASVREFCEAIRWIDSNHSP